MLGRLRINLYSVLEFNFLQEWLLPFASKQFSGVLGHECAAEADFLIAQAPGARMGPESPASQGRADPRRLFEVARLNKMTGFLPVSASALPEGCAALVPQLEHIRLQTTLLNRRGLLVGGRVSRALDEAGIAHVHMKGPLQQVALYGRCDRKPSADIDILVHPQQRGVALAQLRSAGYEQLDQRKAIWWQLFLGEVHMRHPGNGVMVDLHHALQQPGLPRPRKLAGFLEQREELTLEGTRFHVPGPLHRVLLGAISLGKALLSREPCLSGVVDFRAATGALAPEDRARLGDVAREVRLEQTLGLALRILEAVYPAETTLGIDVPRPLARLSDEDLRRMVARPWLEGLPWPRRRELMAELCGRDTMLFMRESARSLLSETLRRMLESGPIREEETAR